MAKQENIRNFSIIAHIDHGKSTLADRMLLLAEAITEREFRNQLLDDMDLERERGITIKARAVSINYEHKGKNYLLNFIDTPGHVDFSYEVSRSLQACEGALLLVDATQGVEAQTVANSYLAMENDLTIVPVMNKMDLPTARFEEVAEEMNHTLGTTTEEILGVSAKSGMGVEDVMEAIIERIPPPEGDPDAPLRALIFDSVFDDYRGIIVYVRLIDGRIKRGLKVLFKAIGREFEVTEVGTHRPFMTKSDVLEAGQVGYFTAAIKNLKDVKVGDTVVPAKDEETEALPGFKEMKPMVFCGLYPATNNEFESLRIALQKLALNDSSFTFQAESSAALGFGFRCGFLGLLHMNIVQERLERESDLEIVQTAPNVTYEILKNDGEVIEVDSPTDMPDPNYIKEFREPYVEIQILTPADSIGNVMKLCEERRATYKSQEYISTTRVFLIYEIPLSEIIYDFHDKLKSATRGFGTYDYEFKEYRSGDLVKVDILVASQKVDALSSICHRSVADRRGRAILQKLRKEIPRHMFQVALQASIGSRVIARENISAMRKNVTAKCYGGDITRKRKLLEKQKAGKKRMKSVGNVQVPQEAFMAVLKASEEDNK